MSAKERAEKANRLMCRLLRSKILFHYKSLSEFDRALGVPLSHVSQRLRGTVELKAGTLLHWLALLDLHPGDFMEEVMDMLVAQEGGGRAARLASRSWQEQEFMALIDAAKSQAHGLVHRQRGWGITEAEPEPKGGRRR